MNPQQLHDALTELDEELVLAAEKRRRAKPQNRWRHFGALAACLCILAATGLTAARRNGLFVERNPTEATATPTQASTAATTDSASLQPTGAELPTLRVRITAWEDGSFTGTVTGYVDTNILPVGTEVRVLLETPVSIELPGKNRTLHYRGLPKYTDFPAGTEVLLRFCYQGAEGDGTVLLRIAAISPA